MSAPSAGEIPVEWKQILNSAYLLLADPRADAAWQISVNEWLLRAAELANKTKSEEARAALVKS